MRRVQSKEEWRIAKIHRPDKDLGYSGIPLASDEESLARDGEIFYRNRISLDEFGFRKVPGRPISQIERCVLIFGDSIPFGVGVEDGETVAAILQRRLGAGERVINFAYTGYGPHQTLRLLELKREAQAVEGCVFVRAVIFGLEEHVQRVAGRVPWGLSGPRYEISGKDIKYVGPFFPEWVDKLNGSYRQVRVVQFLVGAFLGYKKANTIQDIRRYQAVLGKIKEVVDKRYNTNLSVLFLRLGMPLGPHHLELFPPDGIKPIIYLEDFFGGNSGKADDYYLKDKVHLTRRGHELAAEVLFKNWHLDKNSYDAKRGNR